MSDILELALRIMVSLMISMMFLVSMLVAIYFLCEGTKEVQQ